MEWLLGLLGSLFSWVMDFFGGAENAEGVREGGLISGVVNTTKEVGGSIFDWFASDEVATSTKLMAGAGLAYLIAPDATTKVVSKAADGVSKTVGSVANSATSAATTWLSRWWPYLVGGLGIYLLVKD